MLGRQEPSGTGGCLNQRVLGATWRDGISRRDGKAFAREAGWDSEGCVGPGKLEEVERRVIRVGKVLESAFVRGN